MSDRLILEVFWRFRGAAFFFGGAGGGATGSAAGMYPKKAWGGTLGCGNPGGAAAPAAGGTNCG